MVDWRFIKVRYQFFPLTVCCFILLFACGNNNEDDDQEIVENGIDPALVGTWSGNVKGSGPNGETVNSGIIIILESDGKFSSSADTPPQSLCSIEGEWSIKSSKFTSQGFGVDAGCPPEYVVSLKAPRSVTELNGTWSSSTNYSGTFTVLKQ